MKTDNFGNPLEIGDRVVFMGTAGRSSKPELMKGIVRGFTPKGVRVGYMTTITKNDVPPDTPGAYTYNGYNSDTGKWDRVRWGLRVPSEAIMVRFGSDIVKVVPNE